MNARDDTESSMSGPPGTAGPATVRAVRLVPLVACLALVATAASAGAAREARRAVVSLRGVDPVSVRGLYFGGRERAIVRLETDTGTYARRVVASRFGSFTVVFRGVSADPCSLELMVIRRGGVVYGKIPERMCPIPLGRDGP